MKIFLDYFIYYLSLQYLFINIYTIRYSSIRFLILDRIVAKTKLYQTKNGYTMIEYHELKYSRWKNYNAK